MSMSPGSNSGRILRTPSASMFRVQPFGNLAALVVWAAHESDRLGHKHISSCLDPHDSCRAIGLIPFTDHETVIVMKIASWNVNSIRARLNHVTAWLKSHTPDVLLMQELKSAEFPSEVFKELGYESAAVTQKAYNGVAILSRRPMQTLNTTLAGDELDSHARYLETTIDGIRVVNIYLPNGNPVGTDKFAYKLAWMDRLEKEMRAWRKEDLPVLIGGDFNVIPEDIDCHKPASWIHDALFQPEPRARYRALLALGLYGRVPFAAS